MDIPAHLQQPASGNRSRASSAASRYTPENYSAPSPFTQPNTQAYQPPGPPMQQNYPQGGNEAFLMIPPSSQPAPDPQNLPHRESPTPNPPYPISADDPYMRPASHSRHASHSSARSHRSRASSHRSSGRHDEDEADRHHSHHHQHHSQHRRHHSHGGAQYDDDDEGGHHHHPLRQSERANSDVSDLRPLRRRDTRRPTLGDTVVAMWDGLKSVLGPRDRK